MRTPVFGAAALGLLLVACGGGSDSGSGSNTGGGTGGGNGGGSGGGNQSSQQLVVSPEPQTQCRHWAGETEGALERELIIYDDNWQIVSRHPANAAGVMQASLPGQTTVNYGVLSRGTAGNSTHTTLQTYAEHPIKSTLYGATDMMQVVDCECKNTSITITSELGHLSDQITIKADSITNFAMNHQLTRLADNSIRIEDLNVCQSIEGSWPSILVQANTGDAAVAGQLTNYNANEPLQIFLDQTPTQIPLILHDDFSYLNRGHQLINGDFLLSPETLPSGQFAFFPGLENVQYLTTNGYSESADLATSAANGGQQTGSRLFHGTHAVSANRIEISLPSESNFSPMLELKANITEEQPMHYDLRNQDGLVIFYLSRYTMFENGDFLTHIHFGPSQGQFSLAVFPDDVEQHAAIQWKNAMMSLWGYSNINSYQDYLNNDQAKVGHFFSIQVTSTSN